MPKLGWLSIAHGRITDIGFGTAPEATANSFDPAHPPLICPGFIDAHLHLPQIDSIGCDGLDLLDWLDRVIFPAELRWRDPAIAASQVESAYQRLLRSGTLGFAAFLTSHFHGYEATVRSGYKLPLRAIVGQVLMDRNGPPGLMTGDTTKLAKSQRARVSCSLNPRFAVSCSDEMLQRTAKRITDDALIHTHLAESKRECDLVRQLFPNDPYYTAVYERHGLLTSRTLLAHAIHLSDDEWILIAKRQAVVVHCPTANVFLQSGLFDLDAAQRHGVRLALGSDIAAGTDLAMPCVARAMIETAKVRRMTVAPNAHIPTPADAWQLITMGNADALGWPDAGRLEIGAAADLLILQPPFEIDQRLIGRLIYTWRDDFITHRMVAGDFRAPSSESEPSPETSIHRRDAENAE